MKHRRWLFGGSLLLLIIIVLSLQLVSREPEENLVSHPFPETYDTALPVQAGTGVALGGSDELHLLSRVVAAEAGGEPYEGQVAVAAVLLNRVNSPAFPNSLPGVIYQPLAFESVLNGHIWQVTDLSTAQRAALAAMNGWDPTYGSLYFWNPSKPVNPWIWTRKIVRTIGSHVFGL